ncbi:hypothetical protein HMPREF2736_06570 [Corynebacterium sp. HMSC036E10]|uniref:hypothetical protein n=1 Tax=Corynebacterium sp. HMSC036E10 TaxID=1715215 RepID=UPI0008A882A4|nr:hypothetical protein [Corynebacterium sp. HMSC036E10]OHO81437.1 hypothetical protein HMPREF2736_06570 [Corynebacterium sp. HMSC036E10]
MSDSQSNLVLDNERACRFNLPGCTTLQTPLHKAEDEKLYEHDPAAWELTHALIQDAHDYGLDEEDNAELYDSCPECSYRAPMGKRAFRKAGRGNPVPWTGELRVEESGAGDDCGGWWRIYFHDLLRGEILADEVLLSAVRLKRRDRRSAAVGRFMMNQQDRDVLDAIDSARRWERQQRSYQLRSRTA